MIRNEKDLKDIKESLTKLEQSSNNLKNQNDMEGLISDILVSKLSDAIQNLRNVLQKEIDTYESKKVNLRSKFKVITGDKK